MNDRDDVLKRATEALRHDGLGHDGEPQTQELARLRERLFVDNVVPLRARPKSRARSLRWVLPLAAAFFAGTALAATPGAWDGMLHAMERYLPFELHSSERVASAHQKPARPPAEHRTPSAPESTATEPPPRELPAAPAPEAVAALAPQAVAAPAPEAVAAPAPEAVGIDTHIASAHRRPRRSAREPRTEPAASPALLDTSARDTPALDTPAPTAPPLPGAPSIELTRFREAHALQFVRKDYAAALGAWDAYLRASPGSSLALEARYDRALCFVRLGRYREAEVALTPFAQGREDAGYKRAEATRILKALEKLP